MKKSPRPLASAIERLEDRSLPTTFGIPWADPEHLTLSFAPDGTATPLGPSALSSTLGAAASTAAWQRDVLRGFQTWAANANVNIGLIKDGGQSLGTSGVVQGDSRFGDVRVAAAPLSTGVVASAAPFSWTGTTFSGDLMFNSRLPFRVGNVANTYDVYSVAVHEAGHVFGLDHTDAAGSVLNEKYAYYTGLAASDVAAIQALYGARAPDANDAVASNGTTSTASAMKESGLAGRVIADGDLNTRTDVDVYRFSTLSSLSLTSVTVRLQAAGLSLLTPRVTVLNAAGNVVASGSSTNPLSNDVSLKFSNSLLGGTYYVKVEGASGDVFDVGAYRLTVDTVNLTVPLPLLSSLLAPIADGHTNDTLASATDLTGASSTKTDARFDATYRGTIEDSSDTDTYRLRVPQVSGTGIANLNVMVWGTSAMPLNPRVRISNANGVPVAYKVLANDAGLFSIEVGNVKAGETYYLSVAARAPGTANSTGGYFLGADFNRLKSTTYDAVAADVVNPGATTTGTLTIAEAGMFQFALSARAISGSSTGIVTMTLLDAAGRVVLTLESTAGQPLTTAVRYLAAGTYTVRYTTRGTSAPLRYDLFLLKLSDDVGPYASKTNSTATSPPPTTSSGDSGSSSTSNDSGYTYSGSSTSPEMGPPTYY